MLIDFHVHTFPEAIAEKTFSMLLANMRHTYNIDQTLSYGGTVPQLKEHMKETGVTKSVIMPIATKPQQHITINNFAEKIRCNEITSFASLHPYTENIPELLSDLKSRGFVGIKLHPDYQGVNADAEEFISLVNQATELGFYVTIHSGHDTGIKPPFKGTVEKIRRLLKCVDESFIILAHMGAFNQWDEVEEHLLNSKCFFDTSVVSRFITIEQYRRIIDKHGADKIIFGSDAPWESPKDTFNFLKQAALSDEELEMITHKNAEKILNS